MPLIVPKGHFAPVEQTERKFLEPEELKQLFQALKPNPFWYGYFRLQYHYGCRVSEVALVLKEEIDFSQNRILIRRLKKRRFQYKWVKQEVEGKTVRRRVKDTDAVPNSGFESFEYQMPEDLSTVLRSVPAIEGSPWFFCLVSPTNRIQRFGKNRLADLRRTVGDWQAVSRSSAHQAFKLAATDAKLPVDLRSTHVLRHTRATLLLAEGVAENEVQFLLGHQDIQTTQRYLGMAKALKLKFNQGQVIKSTDYL